MAVSGTTAYVVNYSSNTLQAFQIGSAQALGVQPDGSLGLASGDNLGNHTATQNLNLATYQLVGNGGSQGLSISNSGSVGIGTSSPAQLLDVEGSLAPAAGPSTAPVLRLGRPDNTNVRYASSLEVNVGTYGASGSTAAQTQVDFRLGNGNTDNPDLTVLTLLADGRVGMGASSPAAQLEVDLPSASTTASLKLEHRGSNILFHPLSAGGSASVIENTAGNLLLNPSGGNIGINKTNPQSALDVAGDIYATSIHFTSDARFKTNVRPLAGALASVLALRGVRYEWNALGVQHGGRARAPQVGVLAQELEKVYPELVSTDAEGYKAVNYAQLTPVLLEAIKELAARNATLEAAAAADHASLLTLQAQVARLLGQDGQARK